MYEITIIKTDGTIQKDTSETPPDFRYIQKAVGGLIESVPFFDRFEGKPCVAFCNEEGKLERLPLNESATINWFLQLDGPIDDFLVGDVIIICGTPDELAQL